MHTQGLSVPPGQRAARVVACADHLALSEHRPAPADQPLVAGTAATVVQRALLADRLCCGAAAATWCVGCSQGSASSHAWHTDPVLPHLGNGAAAVDVAAALALVEEGGVAAPASATAGELHQKMVPSDRCCNERGRKAPSRALFEGAGVGVGPAVNAALPAQLLCAYAAGRWWRRRPLGAAAIDGPARDAYARAHACDTTVDVPLAVGAADGRVV